MKKFLACVVILAVLAGAAWYAWQRGLLPGPAREGPVVPLVVRGANGVGALRVELIYDPKAAQVEAVKPGDLARNALLEANFSAPGRVVIGLVDVEGIKGEGPVAILTFKPGDPSAATPLTLRSVEAYHAETRYELAPKATAGELAPGGRAPVAPTLDFGRE